MDRRQNLLEYKSKVHQQLISRIDTELLVKFENDAARAEVAKLITNLVNENNFPLSAAEKEQIVREVVNETFGLGPLEPLFEDQTIDDILVNNYQKVFVERNGKLERVDVRFKDNMHLRHIINRIVARVGRRIDDASPMVDARLADGSRVNAIISPLSIDGPALSIRRFKRIPLSSEELINIGTVSQEMLLLLKMAVRARMNIIISGGTGAGKTTLLNAMSAHIPDDERIVTIEDAAELQLQQPHVVRLETRPANMEGKGLVTQRDLFINSLRMRPNRIIVGEVRGVEALEMLQAMNTGHDGSLTSVHANTPRDAFSRIETMVLMSNTNMEQRAIRRNIASAINLVVQIRRYADGIRRIESITEITGMEQETITVQEIACYVQKGMSKDGKSVGFFKVHSVRPKFFDRAKELGISPEDLLTNSALAPANDATEQVQQA
ncbi:MAG: pilus assembly protein CpaF [Omnitrophica bacterium RIFCSPHIGHO2_02_FULL_46_11]|nr:MAG: pilus assembly protein CpaF [Omnitrophica bacterium RIFCSPHIGHO2_02_FULL_46_11]